MAETKDKRGEMLFIFGESWDSETPPLLPDLPSSFELLSWSKHNLSEVRRNQEIQNIKKKNDYPGMNGRIRPDIYAKYTTN